MKLLKSDLAKNITDKAMSAVSPDAAAAPEEVLNAITSSKAADINEGRLTGISPPAWRGAFEGGASVSMVDV
jgi:hypothetical protein